jgi:UDP-glucuronate decarboxylase
MRVLITGGYGFIGSFVAEKFYREGHEVHILDNLSTGIRSNIQFRHQSYLLHVEDEQCEQVFRTNRFDIVIHLAAQVDVNQSVDNPAHDSKINLLGLINILQLSKKYGVSKFVFSSSAAVYGNNTEEIPLNEESTCMPVSPYGINKLLGEYYCQKWTELYHLDTICFRFSNVYGPKQSVKGESGVVSIFTNQILNNESLTIYGDGTQTRDFIYVEDVAEAIFRAVLSDVSGVMNLSTNTETSVNQLVEQFEKYATVKNIIYADAKNGDIQFSRLDNQIVKKEVDWIPKYTLDEGLKNTFKWFQTQKKLQLKEEKTIKIKKKLTPNLFDQTDKPFLPYIENGLLFCFIAFLQHSIGDVFYHIDLLLLYILTIGIMFGKVQAMLASALSVILYSWQGLINGREIVSLFTDHNSLIQFAVYLFVGLLVGYVIENKNIKEETAKDDLQLFKEKYELLNEIYSETRKVKDELQNQILFSEDSVGEIYSIIKKIDSLDPEEVFNGVINVLEQIMKTKEAAIYLVGQGERYLRLVSKSNVVNSNFPSSIEVIPYGPYEKAIRQNEFFINRRLESGLPMLIAPIWKDNQAVAIICINEVRFENLTLYYENLFHVVTSLITTSITRSYEYVNATHHERYVNGTGVLKPEYLKKVIGNKQKAFEQLNIPYTKVKIEKVKDMEQVVKGISSLLRDTDYIGIDEEDDYWVILSNTNQENANGVIRRIQSFIDRSQIQEETLYV